MIQRKFGAGRGERALDEILICTNRMLSDLYEFSEINNNDEYCQILLQKIHVFEFINDIINIIIEREKYVNVRIFRRAKMIQEKYMLDRNNPSIDLRQKIEQDVE